ncbi:P-loop containing nucleoside triphosphate hydrolase [Phytophthora cactorum]|nr:P-loop containing nucleoside triphosphate hydrolase [Phytophthora cactorum]
MFRPQACGPHLHQLELLAAVCHSSAVSDFEHAAHRSPLRKAAQTSASSFACATPLYSSWQLQPWFFPASTLSKPEFRQCSPPCTLPAFFRLYRRRHRAPSVKWPSDLAKRVHRRMRHFPRNYEVKELVVEAGMNQAEWAIAAASFRKSFLSEPSKYFEDQTELLAFGRDLDDVKRHNSFIFYPLETASRNVPVRHSHEKEDHYHEGPTNSGKTHQALERLKQAGEDGGIYCGPLRLLALEIFERMNSDGLYTSLVTGQEKKLVPYSTHVSCTVEMANINRPWDVAVIDEIQLIGDPQRGWAWTRALFGLQAKEIHVCGSGEAVHLVKKFAETTGDDFELRSYERRSPLEIAPKHLESYSHIRSGDCVVAFSRRDIFQIKRDIEIKTGQKCCIIYGQLPPETRSQQARRVVFATVKKYSGSSGGMIDIPPSLAKQIAGRAGRYGSDFASGEATCLLEEDLEYLKESYDEVPTPLTSAGLFPTSEQMEEFAKQLPGITDLADLVDKYVMLARLDGDYFMCNHQDMKDAATLLRDTELTLSDRFTFCMSPVSLRNPLARKVFLEYARAHSLGQSVKLDIYLPKYPPRTAEALGDVEIKAKIIDLYLWLSFRFEDTFVEKDLALELKTRVLELVEQGLVNTTITAKRRRRGGPVVLLMDAVPLHETNWRNDKTKRREQEPAQASERTNAQRDDEAVVSSSQKETDEADEGKKSWVSRVFGS